ncbi:MAG: ribbon-helix-helix protein, CopG family [Bryobacteraceae bacterium]
MIRIQIRLDKQDYTLIKKEARALGVPIAELVRRAIRQTLPQGNQPPWMRYAGFVESGDANSSQLIDDVVYGSKE